MDVQTMIDRACEITGLSPATDLQSSSFLGEGAWHTAYLLTLRDGRKLVMRFPKPVAYGRTVEYNEHAMRSEYASAGYYYQQARKVLPDICPLEFHYHVTPELTFTLETYMGQPIDLANTDEKTAYSYGQQLGDFFRRMAELPNELPGYGFLSWTEHGLTGRHLGDGKEIVYREKDEYTQEMNRLYQAEDISFDRDAVLRKFQSCIERRDLHVDPIVLVNQDMSPENLIIHNGQIALIDPLPLLYNATIFAVNNICNYKYIFPEYHKAPRYAKHHFDRYKRQLHAIAHGFQEAFVQGRADVQERVVRETYLMLVSTAHQHMQALTGELSQQKQIRMGDQSAIRERLGVYLRELEAFQID